MKVAGILQTKNYKDTYSVFKSLKELTDFVIVLDNNSDTEFPYKNECDEYIKLNTKDLWHDLGNQTTLFARAYFNDCDWIVRMDDDIVFGEHFQTKDDVKLIINAMAAQDFNLGLFRLKDLYGTISTYRHDGIWNGKTFPAIYKNWFFNKNINFNKDKRLHSFCYPSDLQRPTHIDINTYHFGNLTFKFRQSRVEKYKIEDKNNVFQYDYDYLLDEEGLKLEKVKEKDLEIIKKKCNIR